MFGFRRHRPHQRFYLLAGMSGKGYRRKQKIILGWSLLAGLVVSGLLALVFYLIYHI